MARQAFFEHLVINIVGGGHERDARHLQRVHAFQEVVCQQCDVLDAFAVELHQELFDLPAGLARLFVQRDADHPVRGHHGLAGQAGVFALDVKVANLFEVEQLFIKTAPVRHAAFVDVVRHVVDALEAVAGRVAVHAVDEFKVDVVDAFAVFKPVDQIQGRAANAFDGGQAQLHGAGGHIDRLCAQFEGSRIRQVRVFHPKRQRASARPVLGSKVAGQAFGFAVDDEVDVALAVEHHVFGAVLGHQREAHLLEQRLQGVGGGGCELDELEAAQAHGVVKHIGHENLQ